MKLYQRICSYLDSSLPNSAAVIPFDPPHLNRTICVSYSGRTAFLLVGRGSRDAIKRDLPGGSVLWACGSIEDVSLALTECGIPAGEVA